MYAARLISAAAVLAGALTACSTGPTNAPDPVAGEAAAQGSSAVDAGAFPVTIEHA